MNDAFHFVRRDIERLFLRSAGGIIGHELGQSPDFGHRCAHAITKPFAHLRNRLFSAGGAVDLNDQFASSQLAIRSEEHTSALQSLMRISYAVFSLKKKNT